jgi:uncharacterized membrane protein YfcA
VIEAVAKLGVSGGIGALIGIVVVWWVEPTTTEGSVLLVVIAIVVSMVLDGIISGSKKQDTKPK